MLGISIKDKIANEEILRATVEIDAIANKDSL